MTKSMANRMEHIKKLSNLISRANDAYYNTETPILSDSEYDKKKELLAKLHPHAYVLQKIGAKVRSAPKSRKPGSKMGSLANIKTVQALNEWKNQYGVKETLITPKIDGLSCELVYDKYELIGAYTRGDGITGSDVTQAAISMKGVPNFIESKSLCIIRGEVFIDYETFTKLNERRIAQGKTPYSLPRSAAAGILLSCARESIKNSGLRFIVWEVYKGNKGVFRKYTSERERLLYAERLGFEVVHRILHKGDYSEEFLEELNKIRLALPYTTDGIVISLNNTDILKKAGWTETCPKGKVAFKFPSMNKVTTVNKITWQVGRTGKITPVAHFTPVLLNGSSVAKASLSSVGNLISLGVGEGSKVRVEKACEIIPQIIEVLTKTDAVIPKNCPKCSTPLVRNKTVINKTGHHLMCTNPMCASRLPLRLQHYFKTIGILGMGPEASKAVGNILDNLYSVYDLPHTKLMSVLGIINGAKLHKAIHENKTIKMVLLLEALGYPSIGTVQARKLAKVFKDVTVFEESTTLQQYMLLVECAGIKGNYTRRTVAKQLFDGRSEIIELCKRLNLQVLKLKRKSNILGKNICITGTLSVKRKEMVERIEDLGGNFVNSLTQKTDILIIGHDAGSKSQYAKDLGIWTLSEEEFNNHIGENLNEA